MPASLNPNDRVDRFSPVPILNVNMPIRRKRIDLVIGNLKAVPVLQNVSHPWELNGNLLVFPRALFVHERSKHKSKSLSDPSKIIVKALNDGNGISGTLG